MDGVQEDLLPDDMENVSGHGEETPVMEECAPSDSETEQESLLQQEPARSVILHKTAIHQIFFVMIITEIQVTIPALQRQLPMFLFFGTVACYTVRNLSHAQSLDDTLSYSSVLSFCTICAPMHLPLFIIIIIIIILLKFKFNRFLNLHSPHIASLIEAGCVTYNKIHNKHIALQIHYIIIKFRKKYIYKYHYQNQVNK